MFMDMSVDKDHLSLKSGRPSVSSISPITICTVHFVQIFQYFHYIEIEYK